MSQHCDHHFLNIYRSHYHNTSKNLIADKRRQLLHIINGDIFYPMDKWPLNLRLLFWKKSISDKDTFKLFLFFIENGGSPDIFGEWILTSQAWTTSRSAEKRARQLDFILKNRDIKSNIWFYYDLFDEDWRYLN